MQAIMRNKVMSNRTRAGDVPAGAVQS
jgi:hypothetical protein